ncbi:MAG: hypothetical protein EXR72_10555 [Myxococcales bacterium]|nr:hypothetical protein [Myxococcales bacterium]
MRRTLFAVFTAVTLLIGGAAAIVLRDAIAPAQAQTPPPLNYEYQTASTAGVRTDQQGDKLLNVFSREGWRFVGVINGSIAVFERPVVRGTRVVPRVAPAPKPHAEEID